MKIKLRLTLIALFALISSAIYLPAQADLGIKGDIPFREDAGLSKAEYLIAREKYSEAAHEANSVLKRHPKNADAYVYRGYAMLMLGDPKKAVADFDRALGISPAHLGANKYRAEMYLEDGDLPKALEQLQVLRMVCGNMQCEELDDLERSINAYKKNKRKDATKEPVTEE